MLRTIFGSVLLRTAAMIAQPSASQIVTQRACFSFLLNGNTAAQLPKPAFCGSINLLQPAPPMQPFTRSVTKFSLVKGKRKTVKAVLKRFKRLDWGAWIRTHSGRQKKLFKKSPALRRRLKQHVFTNSTQSWLLDKMVTNFWRRPKHYVDDPYAPYHKRDEYFATKAKTFKV